eukprot:TRINITY_DN75800_c0_g1_i1.p1 TRINITY_DN75800_c0_g1~~TRINITY_DN75800_c0_g1_i1.p1  ORF type:complete len:487 (-),score=39.32 TRINITY_DN75800_c0_g1_i1:217-1626(-)
MAPAMPVFNASSLAALGTQLCDLLLSFPAAAIGGVPWLTLVQKYEERHKVRLDLTELGHSSALVAASTLLWDVVRIVNGDDTDNPVLAIEDTVALTPQPGLLACWPSLYSSFCSIVQEHGEKLSTKSDVCIPSESACQQDNDGSVFFSLLLSQLKPLLSSHWHLDFEETRCGYVNEHGSFCKFKKLKHLVQAVLRWREQRSICCDERKSGSRKHASSAVDEALNVRLEMVPSQKQNDLELRCFPRNCADDPPAVASPVPKQTKKGKRTSKPSSSSSEERPQVSTSVVPNASNDKSLLFRQLAILRAENSTLRNNNDELRLGKRTGEHTPIVAFHAPVWGSHVLQTSSTDGQSPSQATSPCLEPEVFDDPYEPPPQATTWCPRTAANSEAGTPMARLSSASFEKHFGDFSCSNSGAMTPLPLGEAGQPVLWGQACCYMPGWFSLVPSADVCVIPNGIVQGLRARFESVPK